jgi:flagellar biosynthetic protein FliQ
MSEVELAALAREAVWVLLKLATPLLLTALVVGVMVALMQALTQVNEATLIFVPKLLAIGAVLMLLASFFMQTLSDYTAGLFDRIVAMGAGG